MSIEERIEQVKDEEIADSLVKQMDSEGLDDLYTIQYVISAYGIDPRTTTLAEDSKIIKDFTGRFSRVVAMYQLSKFAEMQQREQVAKLKEAMEFEEAVKMQLVLNVAFDIANFFTTFRQTVEIPSERLISFAEKIVERVRNA